MCRMCLSLAAALVIAGCVAQDRAADQTLLDTLMLADTATPLDVTTDTVPPDSAPAGVPAPPPAGMTHPEPTVVTTRPSLPARGDRLPVRDEFLVGVVMGVAEIEVDSKAAYQQQQQQQQPIYAAAEYLRVVLRGARTLTAVTNRSGQFFFERVPPGKYELIFLTAKEDRRVFTTPVIIERVRTYRIPDVHIPLDSIRGPMNVY